MIKQLFGLGSDRHRKESGLYKYKNYEEYKRIQIEGNIKKIDNVWVSKENILLLSNYIKNHITNPKFGLCHGTRRGIEQQYFRDFLKIDVLGTEISPTASQFPNTIEWDFHKVKDEWIDNVDFIYSNSFDHSYKPKECLDAWMSCINSKGICILEWTPGHKHSTKLDPFGGTLIDYINLISFKYHIKEILRGKKSGGKKDKDSFFLIIEHR